MHRSEEPSLGNFLSPSGSARWLWGHSASLRLDELAHGSTLDLPAERLRDRSVLIAARDQIIAALALIELDGLARRLVVCTPDLDAEHASFVADAAGVDAIVSDTLELAPGLAPELRVRCSPMITPGPRARRGKSRTEWVLLTSGTTGPPKMVMHTLSSLIGAIRPRIGDRSEVVWSTFYDVRRYGGLQIFLRALMDGVSLVLSDSQEPADEFLARVAAHGVTHISGTPSHWRRALMSPSARGIAPQYVRLSGEIADQAILDRLRAFYPDARVVHAFATTEAGVAFEVADGMAGFPANLIADRDQPVQMKIDNGSLRIRSARVARRYLGANGRSITDNDGFVDTGDMLELRGDRYYFVGRCDGIINVGGLKVHPEEVESVINRHPKVQMSLVRGRKNPITGAVVVADVVVKPGSDSEGAGAALKHEILNSCHRELAAHKIPATIRFVPSLDFAKSGKLARVTG